MNSIALITLLLCGVALLALPRAWAALPLLAGACYVTRAQGIDIGPLSFTVVRILVVIGVLRVAIRRELPTGGLNGLDWLMVLWGICMILTGFYHADAIVNRLGLTFDGWGLYFLFRTFCRSREDFFVLARVLAIVLMPIAVEMVIENATRHNMFSFLGGVPESPVVREGRVRAQGPFAHSILAGNIGAVSLPLLIGLWQVRRSTAVVGIAACLAMIYASSSSGPVMTAMAGIGALMLWQYRFRMGLVLAAAALAYVALELIMEDPAYFIMARIDISGGSTGWHRARLIESSFQHLSEWWFAGTDYTRHWMASGVAWSPNHTDITNHYLRMGVLGGLPLMLLFIAVVLKAFTYVGQGLRRAGGDQTQLQFVLWACGASLFAHAATCISVSYFDQSIVFLYLSLGTVVGVTQIGVPLPAAAAAAAPHMPRPTPRASGAAGRVPAVRPSPTAVRSRTTRFVSRSQWTRRTEADLSHGK